MNHYIKSISNYPIKKDKPWLILGKGPTFSKVWKLIRDKNYYTIALNHVGSVFDADICHVIDIAGLPEKANNLFIPLHPHVDFAPIKRSILESNTLDKFENTYTYNLSTYKGQTNKFYPLIRARYFSAEAVFNILSMLRITTINSLGIDGGTEYAEEFFEMGLKPLTNGRDTFDDGIKELTNLCLLKGLTWNRL